MTDAVLFDLDGILRDPADGIELLVISRRSGAPTELVTAAAHAIVDSLNELIHVLGERPAGCSTTATSTPPDPR